MRCVTFCHDMSLTAGYGVYVFMCPNEKLTGTKKYPQLDLIQISLGCRANILPTVLF